APTSASRILRAHSSSVADGSQTCTSPLMISFSVMALLPRRQPCAGRQRTARSARLPRFLPRVSREQPANGRRGREAMRRMGVVVGLLGLGVLACGEEAAKPQPGEARDRQALCEAVCEPFVTCELMDPSGMEACVQLCVTDPSQTPGRL